jgi:hypothetical protein
VLHVGKTTADRQQPTRNTQQPTRNTQHATSNTQKMESSKLNIKFYLADPNAVKLEAVVPIFHSWIQTHALADHMLIDVADYAHVPNGPGVVLVAHEANLYLDTLDGRAGLTYSRKQPLDGSFPQRLGAAFSAALQACALLDESMGGVRFVTDEASLKINDRLFAPNNLETFAAVKPDVEAIAREVLGQSATIEHRGNAKQLFEVAIRSLAQTDLRSLMQRLGIGRAAAV